MSTTTKRFRQGRANIVLEEYRDGHWWHVSDVLPGDARFAEAWAAVRAAEVAAGLF
jgi:hypothetical protein